jgi:GxxExxY protein
MIQLSAIFEVSNTLGAGFLEKVYRRALLRELSLRGLRATAEASFAAIYKGHAVGEYFRISWSRIRWWWN